ncbi:hypothetical protein D9611_008542 [Ephemerocybe angulata]|uniref:Cytochrome b-c1 complex subunit 8 n=2 Tax=Ephemerocybe angulata TaxID=980116 RepID=A0A8H5AZI5_9AGAR|nr:hypothetical protein D9611_014792 [Tulosesus angulatus]KAF5313501.1 hypothetical protein D9611_008542 [Tulosesus angulatus]KAF6751125.1 cytochrome b-c1 complex subunit 8 [Tulosesus angulatus]
MRPTVARLGDMPGPKVYNLWWGDKSGGKIKGVTTYTLSSYQSKVAPKWLSKYIFNGFRRISGELFFFGVPFAVGYATYSWAKSYDAWANSKAGHIAMEGKHHD